MLNLNSTQPPLLIMSDFSSSNWGAQTTCEQENSDPNVLPPLDFEKLGSSLDPINWETQELKQIQKLPSVPKDSLSSFAQFHESILAELENSKFSEPTEIQASCWGPISEGKDLVGVAATGSGKTLAYLLPGLTHVHSQNPLEPGEAPIMLVLSPTRELAKQIVFECNKFGKGMDIKCVCLYGGNGRKFQMKDLEVNPQVVVATPGRFLDFLENGIVNLKRASYLVIDEADKMLDMGFEQQLTKILSQARPDRQTLMWTATWLETLNSIAESFMKDPKYVHIGNSKLSVNQMITQEVRCVEDKFSALLETLEPLQETRVLIFCDTKAACEELADNLKDRNYKVATLHGQKSQKERMEALLDFRAGRTYILVSTDLASRGLDVRDLENVVIYDFPRRMQDYVHRIGRTARGGRKGRAVVLFTSENSRSAQEFVELLEEAGQEVPSELKTLAQKKPPRKRCRSRSPRN